MSVALQFISIILCHRYFTIFLKTKNWGVSVEKFGMDRQYQYDKSNSIAAFFLHEQIIPHKDSSTHFTYLLCLLPVPSPNIRFVTLRTLILCLQHFIISNQFIYSMFLFRTQQFPMFTQNIHVLSMLPSILPAASISHLVVSYSRIHLQLNNIVNRLSCAEAHGSTNKVCTLQLQQDERCIVPSRFTNKYYTF